jgi:hypothetical protein
MLFSIELRNSILRIGTDEGASSVKVPTEVRYTPNGME